MTTLARPRLDPLLDAPLVGPSAFAIVPDDRTNDACSMWRIWQPFSFLHLHGYPVGFARRQPLVVDHHQAAAAAGYDLHLLCRVGAMPSDEAPMLGWFAQMRDAGKTVIYECDDDLFTPFSSDQLARRAPNAPSAVQLEAERAACVWVLERCAGVTVSTQYLASVVRRFTAAPVEVVPNAIDAQWFERLVPLGRRTVPGLTIGWAGGHRPGPDFTAMAVAWGRLARRYPRVTFVVQGSQNREIARHVPAHRLHPLPWMTVFDYPHGLLNIDIGCCPLEDRPFNRAKTPIKAWEYALCGAAVVASPTVYQRVIDHGRSGAVVATADEWEEALSRLVEDEDRRRATAAALKADVLAKWSLKQNYWRWPAAWNRLWRGQP